MIRYGVSRRGALGAGLTLSAGAMASAGSRIGGEVGRRKGRVIDFRVRPPYKSLRPAFFPHTDRSISDEVLMEGFLRSMDDAGIDLGVVMGRSAASGGMEAAIPNDEIAELAHRYPKRFVGFGAVDVRTPPAAIAEIKRCKQLGLRGMAFDNPLSAPPLYDDDEALLPIYEVCAELGLIISLTSSIMVGPDLSYSDPVHIQRAAQRFPTTPFVIPHACWPWVTQAIALALSCNMFKRGEIYLIPDFYLGQAHAPGRQDYIDAANFGVSNRILHASSHPALPLKDAADAVSALPFKDDEVRRNIMHDNAARLLHLSS